MVHPSSPTPLLCYSLSYPSLCLKHYNPPLPCRGTAQLPSFAFNALVSHSSAVVGPVT